MNLPVEIELKNQTRENIRNSSVGTLVTYSIFVTIGTLGNAFVVVCYCCNLKKNPTFLPFIVLSIVQLIILYMNFFDSSKSAEISVKLPYACAIFNFIYKSFLLIEPWYDFYYLIHITVNNKLE